MKTKCIVIGQSNESNKDLKPIEFELELDNSNIETTLDNTNIHPSDYNNIELISLGMNKNYYDTMFAYDNDERSRGTIFLGYWNDGIVKSD